MRQKILKKKPVYFLIAVLFTSLALAGCSSTVKERKGEPAKRESEATGKYYLFEDIRIPKELNYQQKKAMVYETTGFKAGVLYFTKWRLDVESLIDFFNYHMEKDNWKLVNSFKGKESILNFSKPDKTCMIKISDNWYGKTEVEIRVGPLGEKKM
ncbi:MAG: hypothetical protein FJ107_09095 [Deltaproteobacteria bacterium]|nr:hypothetical protein [Deltaproteobacteria bacterium]